VVDLNGMIIVDFKDLLQTEFDKLLSSDMKTVAVQMANVVSIDAPGLSVITTFYNAFISKGRFSAFLDPSKEIEDFIASALGDKKIPIFGTEKAFEEKAFEENAFKAKIKVKK
jgi:hypothetical protein